MIHKLTILFLSGLLCVTMMSFAWSMKSAADAQSIRLCSEFGYMDSHACDDCKWHGICEKATTP